MKYTLYLKDSDRTQKFTADSISEGLAQIKIPFAKGPYKLKVVYGKREIEKLFYPPLIKRIQVNKIYRAILEKRFNAVLNA